MRPVSNNDLIIFYCQNASNGTGDRYGGEEGCYFLTLVFTGRFHGPWTRPVNTG